MPQQRPAKPPPRERPAKIVMTMLEIGAFICDMRQGLGIRQADLARRAHVGRQWIVDFEQGKPTLEIAMVLRTLETMGFEIELKPYVPLPPWIARAVTDAEKRHAARELARKLRRRARRREIARATRRSANHPRRKVVDVE